jgi:gluconate kinase
MVGAVDRKMSTPQLTGWIPIRLYWKDSRFMADWCYLGPERFTEPFFDQTIGRCLSDPFKLLFRHQTPIEVLGEWKAEHPGLPPAGFIFHMSRCGSTLISQMLAALSQNVVISEAGPIDSVLRAHFRNPNVTDDLRVEWLQWVVSALGQQRDQERHYFIKFDCWHTLDLALIRRAFPRVPWVFVYREPVEVIVSNLKLTAGKMIPGPVEASLIGLEAATVFEIPKEEYIARVVGKFCEAALEHHHSAAMLINYRQLPEVVWDTLLDVFQVTCTMAEKDRLRHISQFDAKQPSALFVDDTEAKRSAANEMIHQMVKRWIGMPYKRLEAARRAQVEK